LRSLEHITEHLSAAACTDAAAAAAAASAAAATEGSVGAGVGPEEPAHSVVNGGVRDGGGSILKSPLCSEFYVVIVPGH
jgi:hypothetical protein